MPLTLFWKEAADAPKEPVVVYAGTLVKQLVYVASECFVIDM
jgi:hypothetical protein